MATIRTFVLKFPTKSRTATSVSFGWKICLIMFLFSTIFAIAFFLRSEIRLTDMTVWESDCYAQSSNETSNEAYTLLPSQLSMWNHSLFSKIQLMLDGIFSKILPAALFPILALLLIVQLRKIEESRNRMFSDSNQNKNSTTTKLVLFNTISYMISALPTGILEVLYVFVTGWCNEIRCTAYSFVMAFLTSLMTLTHFPICLAMSSQYRSTVAEFFRSKKNSGTTISRPISG
ncbi:unnamed protein product [Caenorhabditis nigoni]